MRAVLDRQLERAFRLGPGPQKEREINRLALELIATLTREASPKAREVWFDWDSDGLCITSVRDRRGTVCIEPDEVDDCLQIYASNVRDARSAPELAAIRGNHGPFVLYLYETQVASRD